jgi:hypothetical protein
MGVIEVLLGLIVVIGDVWAIVNVLMSRTTTAVAKFIWVLLILLLPVIGLIVWLVAGPRKPKA